MKPSDWVADDELKRHNCLESSTDGVPGDEETTAFKRRARLQQALWREKMGYPMGTQPIVSQPGSEPRPLGSRLEWTAAYEHDMNFLNDDIWIAVQNRLNNPQKYELLRKDRLFWDLLSSMPMCFNLFGSFHGHLDAATKAVRRWWPDVPGHVSKVKFEWSPGRMDPQYLNNRSAFDVAFELALEGGARGVVGIETKYHEHCKVEAKPKEDRLERYKTVAEDSGVFRPEAFEAVIGKDLQQTWIDHLLALSMRQHPSGGWRWAKFVLVYPEKNPSFARATARYSALLADKETFQPKTIESLLDAKVLPPALEADFRDRYLW